MDKIFPEYESVFSDVFGKTSREILTLFSSPADFEDIGADKLKLLLDRVTMKKFARKKLAQLSDKAKNSFGITFGIQSLNLQLQLLIAQISFIEEQISQLNDKIAQLLDKLNSPITTIPGVGSVLGATILSEIGDITRFATPAKLVAFAGLDSIIDQSGTSRDSKGKMTRGCW